MVKRRGRCVVCTCSQFSYKLRPITFFSWQGKKNAHKAKEESSKRSQRKSEREEEKNGQKLLMMASSSSEPGSWLIKPSYGMDGGWIGQRGCCCGPVGMCPGEGRGWKSGQKFFFRFCFRAAAISQKTKTHSKGAGREEEESWILGQMDDEQIIPQIPRGNYKCPSCASPTFHSLTACPRATVCLS